MPKSKIKLVACPNCGQPTRIDLDYEELAKQDLINVSYHEAGHYVILKHFGIRAEAFIADSGCRCMNTKPFFGTTLTFGRPKTSVEDAVLGMAGIIGEAIPKAKTLSELADEVDERIEYQYNDLSESDRSFAADIEGPGFWQAVKLANKALWRRREEIEEVAVELRLNGVYPTTASRYSELGHIFMKSLPPAARMAFARGEFNPSRPIVPPKIKKSFAADASREFNARQKEYEKQVIAENKRYYKDLFKRFAEEKQKKSGPKGRNHELKGPRNH